MFPSCLLHQPSNQTKLFSPYPNSFILPKLLTQRKPTHFVPLSQPPKRNPNSFLPFSFFTTELIEKTFELFFFSIVEFNLRKKGMLDFLSSFSFSFYFTCLLWFWVSWVDLRLIIQVTATSVYGLIFKTKWVLRYLDNHISISVHTITKSRDSWTEQEHDKFLDYCVVFFLFF